MSGVLEMAVPAGSTDQSEASGSPRRLATASMRLCTSKCPGCIVHARVCLRAVLHKDSLDITNHDLPTQEVPYSLGIALSRLALDLR